MAKKPRHLTQETMLDQIEQVLRRGQPSEPPAYTLILGAGASFGSVPTAKQMLGLPHSGITHPQSIPVWLYEREHGHDEPSALPPEQQVRDFWTHFQAKNPPLIRRPSSDQENKSLIGFKDSLPDSQSIAQAYKAIFDQKLSGGINTAGEASTYLREITLPADSPVKLNSAHFFLASLLALQRRTNQEPGDGGKPQYVGRRHFARTIFTTNFDPLLQTSLQLFQLLYYMTDRPDLLSADALQTDAHPAIHLFYAHGSVHRSFLANTDDEINFLADKNARELSAYLGLHGVIVLGYSGWDDCLLRALQQTSNFRHNLYWLARDEASLSPEVSDFLRTHPSAYWVKITDGGEFMASLHERLCPGMRNTELLSNPIRPLREQLEQVVLTGVARETPDPAKMESSAENTVTVSAPTTPEEFRQQIINLLQDAERRFTDDVADLDPAARLRKLEHQADLAYSGDDWLASSTLYTKIVDDSAASPAQRARAYFRRGYAFSRQGQPEQAIADYTRAIDLPGVPPVQVAQALINRGVVHRQQDKLKQAIADYTQAIGLSDAPPEQVAKALVNRGFVYGQQDKPEQAIADYTQAIGLPSAPPEQVAMALVNRGVTYAQQGKVEQEIADYTQAIGLPSAPPEQVVKALVYRGITYGQQDKPEQAIADYTQVIGLPSAPPEQVAMALVNRGVTYAQQGKVEQAIADYMQAIILPGAPPEQVAKAYLGRGHSFKQTNDLEKARIDWKQVTQLNDVPPDIMQSAKNLLVENSLPSTSPSSSASPNPG